MPICSMRSAALGCCPSGSPSVAEVTPTLDCAAAVPASASAATPSHAARRRDTLSVALAMPAPPNQPSLEAPAYPKHAVIVDKCVVGYCGISHKTPAGQAESRAVIERDGHHEVGNCIRLIPIRIGVDRGVGGIVGPPLLGHRQADRPGQAGLQDRVQELEGKAAADADQLVALPDRL